MKLIRYSYPGIKTVLRRYCEAGQVGYVRTSLEKDGAIILGIVEAETQHSLDVLLGLATEDDAEKDSQPAR